ncbi:GntR family transcriptional regulator [Streptomyces sp. NBC_01549]|uniref:GntR family transcriptional regulator n=1 Tax=Streptomyces sp. NBC_01549 TaxID=2975874 RepID=UPI00225497FA|nr:GntR family transcriptional regulator [Streptomyces sp. NBC_01549]MCX4592351.1 GntR family transcriptional regulator [Streptomyces sp. NBC_01549]
MVRDASGKAPYRRIADQVIGRIDSGELQPGDAVPSVSQIMETESVSRATAARVLTELRSEGYVVATPGVGTVVAARKPLTAGATRLTLVRAGGDGFRDGERVEIIAAELTSAPEDVADSLGIQPGEPVIRRQRRYIDDEGVSALSTSWLAGSLAEAAPELIRAEPLPRMTFALVEERTGRRVVRRRDTVTTRPTPDDAAELLDVAPGTIVLVMTNQYSDQNGDITEYAVDLHPPGRTLSAEYDVGEGA